MDELDDSPRVERWLRDWGTLTLIACAFATVGAGLLWPAVGVALARVLLLGAGPGICAVAAYRAYDRPVANRWMPSLILLLSVAVAELAAVSALFLPADIDRVTLAVDGPHEALLDAPAARTFRLRARTRATRPMEISLRVERGGTRRTIDISLADDARFIDRRLTLGAPTTPQLRVALVDSDSRAPIEVAAAPVRRRLFFWWMSPLLFVLAVAFQAVLARGRQRAPLAAPAGAIGVMALLVQAASPEVGMRFAAGVLLASGIGGGIGGWVLGGAASVLWRRRTGTDPTPPR